jgi:hypothetical protein
MPDEANLTARYRQGRRNFIAAGEAAGGDIISRVHPAKAADGKSLFCDSVALGPRDGARALLLIEGDDGAVTALLQRNVELPKTARLVAVHALDPFARACGKPGMPADWPDKTLAAIATEDLARTTKLTVLDFSGKVPEAALAAALPKAAITARTIKPEHAGQAFSAAIAAL